MNSLLRRRSFSSVVSPTATPGGAGGGSLRRGGSKVCKFFKAAHASRGIRSNPLVVGFRIGFVPIVVVGFHHFG